MALLRKALASVVKSDAPPEEGKPRVWKFRANDASYDRYNDRNRVEGWKLENFNSNPIILFNHEDGSGGFWGDGRKDVLPIGKGKAYVEGDALMVDIEFDQDDEFARRVERKVEKGILNAVSVRYRMLKYHENDRGGWDSEEHELYEISVVNLPGHQGALRVKDAEDAREAFADLLVARLMKALDARAKNEPAPSTETPAAPAAPAAMEEPKAEESPAPTTEAAPAEAAAPSTSEGEKSLVAAVLKFLKET